MEKNIRHERLEEINEIRFSHREMDIIATLLSRKSAKSIASFLSIAPRTVETHIRNVMMKLNCSSRDDVINFIENSNKLIAVKQHYSSLLKFTAFEKCLKEIPKLLPSKICVYLIIYGPLRESNNTLFHQFKKHLSLAGLTISIKNREEVEPIDSCIHGSKVGVYTIYIIPEELQKLEKINASQKIIDKVSANIFCICFAKEESSEVAKDLKDNEHIYFIDHKNYYYSFFEILKKLLPSNSLLRISEQFIQNYEHINTSAEIKSEEDLRITKESSSQKVIGNFLNSKTRYFIAPLISIIIVANIAFFIYYAAHIKNIETEINGRKKISRKPWNLPRQDHAFIGREELLHNLHNKLHNNDLVSHIANKVGKASTIAITACAGLGGIGKTQLALQYIHHNKYPYTFRAWFPAENLENLRQKYSEFAKLLGYVGKNDSIKSIVTYVKNWLAEHPGWLLVYDNVNSYDEIKSFLPEKGGYIILTTRQRNWPTAFKLLPINVMTEEESINTLASLTQRSIEKEANEAKILANILGYLPLALSQAGAYIKQNQISIADYLKLYKTYEIELLRDATLPEGENTYPVAITWNISLEAIVQEAKRRKESPISIELLTVCSYLAPDRISRELLLAWLKEAHSEILNPTLILNKHIGMLWKYSMINYDGNVISIHRLVQTVLRDQLQKSLSNHSRICENINLKWYESLLSFFINNENSFKLTNSFVQLIETRNRFRDNFKNEYDEKLAELDLVVSSIYFAQENHDMFLRTLNEVNIYLAKHETLNFLKSKIFYLYSAYYRKLKNYNKSAEMIDHSMKYYEYAFSSQERNEKDLKNLKGKILFNKVNLIMSKRKADHSSNKNIGEIQVALKLIQEATSLFNETHNMRDKLRSIELYGRILLLLKQGKAILTEFNKYKHEIENVADDRTKMIFYLTYSDAFLINNDFQNSLNYCEKAQIIAKNLDLEKELINIDKKKKEIISFVGKSYLKK